MREMAFAKRLSATVSSAALFILIGGCSLEAEGDSAAHALAEKFAKEATRSDSQKPRRAESAKSKSGDRNTRVSEQRSSADEDDMLARARAEAEQRREDMLKERAAAEQADLDHKAEESKRLEQLRRAEEERALAQQRADEERRLAAARKVEEEARVAEAARQTELARKAEEEQRLAEARRAEEQARAAEEARRVEAQRRADDERRLAEKLKAEDDARVAEALRQAERTRQADIERQLALQRAEEAERRAEAQRLADEANRRAKLEVERELEGQRLADRLRQAREEREAREIARLALGETQATAPVERGSSESREEREVASSAARLNPAHSTVDQRESRRVAVLLLMEPGDRGIRRNNKTADPVLCGYDDCYVSNGPDRAATMLKARRALGFFRTWGQRAGACNNSLGCVFRDVDLEALEQQAMPVDMRVVRHDRREMQHISAASDCRLEGGRLACRTDVRSDDYVMWIVPESLAEKAGPAALERALSEGLHMSARTALGPSGLR